MLVGELHRRVDPGDARDRDRRPEELVLAERRLGADVSDDSRRDDRAVALPPVSKRAPLWRVLSRRAVSTRRASRSEISVPMSALSGSPARMASTFGTSASMKSPTIARSASTRWTEMQTWPAFA